MKETIQKIRNEWNNRTKGIVGTVIYILMGFILAYLLNIGIGIALNTDTPMVAVFSESMVPTFEKGDLAIVSGIDKDVSVGDIIVFDIGMRDYPIIHRVYNIAKNGDIQTKGDNNAYEDPWLLRTKETIHGKAIFRIPFLGWIKVLAVEGLQFR